jgi:hypothetical protein
MMAEISASSHGSGLDPESAAIQIGEASRACWPIPRRLTSFRPESGVVEDSSLAVMAARWGDGFRPSGYRIKQRVIGWIGAHYRAA